MPRYRWSAEQTREIVAAYQGGMPILEVAKRAGCGYVAVRNLLVSRGIEIRSPGWNAKGRRST